MVLIDTILSINQQPDMETEVDQDISHARHTTDVGQSPVGNHKTTPLTHPNTIHLQKIPLLQFVFAWSPSGTENAGAFFHPMQNTWG